MGESLIVRKIQGGSSAKLLVERLYTNSQTWVCPPGVNKVTVVCVGRGGLGSSYSTNGGQGGSAGGGGGLGWKNNYSVTPGTSYAVTIDANNAFFNNTGVVRGGNGGNATPTFNGGIGGSWTGDGGGSGGEGGNGLRAGGGGAGGYSGTGGRGADGIAGSGRTATAGSGGGGGGGTNSGSNNTSGGGGGGVGVFGQGTNGGAGGGGGSGGNGGLFNSGGTGGNYGGGASGYASITSPGFNLFGNPGSAVVRIIYIREITEQESTLFNSTDIAFPSSNVSKSTTDFIIGQ